MRLETRLTVFVPRVIVLLLRRVMAGWEGEASNCADNKSGTPEDDVCVAGLTLPGDQGGLKDSSWARTRGARWRIVVESGEHVGKR